MPDGPILMLPTRYCTLDFLPGVSWQNLGDAAAVCTLSWTCILMTLQMPRHAEFFQESEDMEAVMKILDGEVGFPRLHATSLGSC